MFNLGKTINSAGAKALQSARDQAKQIAKQEGEQWLKSVQGQGEVIATGQVQQQPDRPPQLFPDIEEVKPEEEQKINQESQSLLQRLEGELAQLRQQRAQQEQQWVKQQNQMMNPGPPPGQEKKPMIMPTSKPKGPNAGQIAAKQKSGSREMAKQRSG